MDYINKEVLTKEQVADLEKFFSISRSTMDERLYRHTLATLKYADLLSRQYIKDNPEDLYRLYAAAILHDIAKPLSTERQIEIIAENETDPAWKQYLHQDFAPILHGFCAYFILRQEFGIRDEKILHSVRFHTVGYPNMEIVDKILYISDKIEEMRNYDNIAFLRELSIKNINLCLLEVYKNNIIYIIENNRFLYWDTSTVWNNICKKYGGLNGSR